MKVPLGVVIESNNYASNKALLSPLDMGHYLKLPALTFLSEKFRDSEITIIEKLRQIINQIISISNKNNDTKIWEEATKNLPKIKTKVFTKNLELIEKEVVFLNLTQTSDLMPPDGELLKKLISTYPQFYKNSKTKMRLSKLIEMAKSGENFIILNDLYNPFENRIIIEYGEKITNQFLAKNESEFKPILREHKIDELTDKLSTGEVIAKDSICNYYGIFLKKSGEILDDNFFNSDELKNILKGDPEVYYIEENRNYGNYIFDKNENIANLLKKILKNFSKSFNGEFKSLKEIFDNIKNLKPKVLIIGIDSTNEIEDLIKLKNEAVSTDFVLLLSNKDSNIETKLRNQGFTFIFDKRELLNNFNQFSLTLNNILEMLE